MHKSFYASGFLYHSPSRQILLQQACLDNETKHFLFREKSSNGKDPQTVFQQCIEKALGIPIDVSSIRPVYDYIHTQLGAHYIFYVEVAGDIPTEYKSANKTEWVPLSKLSKYAMSNQTRHDIIIGERVIRSFIDAALPPHKVKRANLQT